MHRNEFTSKHLKSVASKPTDKPRRGDPKDARREAVKLVEAKPAPAWGMVQSTVQTAENADLEGQPYLQALEENGDAGTRIRDRPNGFGFSATYILAGAAKPLKRTVRTVPRRGNSGRSSRAEPRI